MPHSYFFLLYLRAYRFLPEWPEWPRRDFVRLCVWYDFYDILVWSLRVPVKFALCLRLRPSSVYELRVMLLWFRFEPLCENG